MHFPTPCCLRNLIIRIVLHQHVFIDNCCALSDTVLERQVDIHDIVFGIVRLPVELDIYVLAIDGGAEEVVRIGQQKPRVQ